MAKNRLFKKYHIHWWIYTIYERIYYLGFFYKLNHKKDISYNKRSWIRKNHERKIEKLWEDIPRKITQLSILAIFKQYIYCLKWWIYID